MEPDEAIEKRLDLSSKKISQSKILSLDDKNFDILYDKVKIISIESQNFEKVEKLLEDIKEENFPNVFVICIELKDEEEGQVERIKVKIDEKFPKVQLLLLQINSKNFLRKANENFKEIELNLSEEVIQKSLNDSKFSTEIFLNIQKGSKITEWNFGKFLKYEKVEHKIFLNAINSRDSFCFRLLKLFDFKFSQEIESEIYRSVIQNQSFEIFLAFFDAFDEIYVTVEKVKEILEIEGQKRFLTAVECRNLKVVEFFVAKFSELLTLKVYKEALDLSVKREFFEIFNELKNFLGSLSKNGEKVLEEIAKLHENIENGNLEKVKEFSENFKDQRLCYGTDKVCAIEHAIDCGQMKIFSYLRANGFYTDRTKELEIKIGNLSESQQDEIRTENLKYVQEIPNAFIGVLTSKCKFDALSPVPPSEVQEMLTDLSQLDQLRPFLQIAAQADLKIIFDFATESVKNMVPGYDEHVMGLAFFNRGELYVGRNPNTLMRYSTFMHELTHMVLNLIYENSCLPYCEDDTEREREWDQIVGNENINYQVSSEELEPIIRWVFQCYNEGWEQHAELAVRPNHIMAQYFDDPERVEELREIHAELFDYFQNFVMRDLQIPNVFRLVELNKKFELVESIESSELQLQSSDRIEIINNVYRKLVLTSNVPKLALSKLLQEIKNLTRNKLNVKVKNLFVDVQKLDQIYFENELESLLESSDIDRVIFDVTGSKNVDKVFEFVKELRCSAQFFIVCDKANAGKFVDDLKFDRLSIEIRAADLTSESCQKLVNKSINFQGRDFPLSTFTDTISNESLPLLCSNHKFSINVDENLTSIKNFISRIVERENINLSSEDFATQSDQILVLSAIAGNGKTTLLRKVGESLLEQFPKHWISFVSLRNFIKQLSESSLINFENSFVEMLNLTQIEREIFKQKFAKGEVKILFDGFDEISPECKDETLKLFKLFKVQSKNQIFITTRTHLEHDLEVELKVKKFGIKTLTKKDQIKFLCDSWKSSHADEKFVQLCAQLLTHKISEIVSNFPNLIGIPIIIESLAKLYVNKIDENFQNEIKNLKISKVYVKIFEALLSNLNKSNPKVVTKRLSVLQVHEYFAVVYFFDRAFALELGLTFDEREFSVEEISKFGILTYDKNGEISFNHHTYAENLLSNFISSIFYTFDELKVEHKKLLKKILSDEKFKISQIFLDESLEDFNQNKPKIFEAEEDLKLLKLVVARKLPNLFKIFLSSNLKSFCNFEAEIVDFFPRMADDEQIFDNFFEIFDLGEDFLRISLRKNKAGETILHSTVKDFEKFQTILNSIKKTESEIFLKELIQVKNEEGENVLMTSTLQNENSLKLLLKFVESFMDKKEIEKLLSEVDNEGNNILHFAALYLKSKETFEFFWQKVSENVQNPKEFLMRKGFSDRNALQKASQNRNGPEISASLLNLAKSFCQSEVERKNFILEKNMWNENLLTHSVLFAPKPNLEFLLEIIIEIFGFEEMKNLLKTAKGFNGRNLLSSAVKNKSKDSIEFLWNVFEENLSGEEIFELLNEKDKDGDNVLHLATRFAESKEIFEFVWLKIFENFKGDEEKLKNYLKPKGNFKRKVLMMLMIGSEERNILLMSIRERNENYFFYIFENIFEKFFGFKNFIYECKSRGENFLHQLARFGSVPMLEFAFEKLEKKLPFEELISFLMLRSEKYQQNLLHCAALQNTNLDAIKLLVAKIEEILSKNELKELLNQKDWFSFFPLHCAIWYNTSDIFEYFTKLYEENFTKIEIKNILEARDFRELANWNEKDKNVKEKVENFYKTLCD